MKTQPSLVVSIPTFDLASVLQFLEGQRASGTLSLGDLWLRFNGGQIVRSSGDLCDASACAQETIALLAESVGELTFWPAYDVTTSRPSIQPTALLLEVARASDEAAR